MEDVRRPRWRKERSFPEITKDPSVPGADGQTALQGSSGPEQRE